MEGHSNVKTYEHMDARVRANRDVLRATFIFECPAAKKHCLSDQHLVKTMIVLRRPASYQGVCAFQHNDVRLSDKALSGGTCECKSVRAHGRARPSEQGCLKSDFYI